MRLSIKRALCVFAALAVLAADAMLTWRIATRTSRKPAEVETAAKLAAADPLGQFRLEREQLRARQEAQLNDIIYSDRSDAQTVARAQEQLLSMLTRAEQEMTLEGLLQGRGFEEALVSVGERSANVLVRGEAVTQQESAVILELALRETGLTGGNVKIIPVK